MLEDLSQRGRTAAKTEVRRARRVSRALKQGTEIGLGAVAGGAVCAGRVCTIWMEIRGEWCP